MSWIREQFTFADLQRLLFRLSERVKAFQGLTPAEIAELLGSSEKCSFAPGAHIVKEGSVGTHMYIILSGEARVLKSGRDGAVELARLAPADSFGEMSLADNEARSASVVLPVNKKFQPTPSRKSASKNWCSSTPVSATAMQAPLSSTPTAMTGSVPKRLIRWPVKNPGANMPITCHCSTSAASSNGKPQTCMASGVAAMSRFITP